MTDPIKTYTNELFRANYVQPEPEVDVMLKLDFGRFFIARVEEVLPLMKLPVPPSRSTNHLLVYLTAGEATMSVGSETYPLRQDECLFVPAGQVFSVDEVDLTLNRGYLCNLHDDFLTGRYDRAELLKDYDFFRVWGNPSIRLDESTAPFVEQLFDRMLQHYAAHGLTRFTLIQAILITLLSEINQAYQPTSASPQSQAALITNQFKERLFTHYKTHHLVTEYAGLLHITPNHLNKSVRLITGKSPIKWIDEAIVLEAKVLLYQTKLSVSEVAAEVGILDASRFSRLFKKQTGITPVAFRKLIEIA